MRRRRATHRVLELGVSEIGEGRLANDEPVVQRIDGIEGLSAKVLSERRDPSIQLRRPIGQVEPMTG